MGLGGKLVDAVTVLRPGTDVYGNAGVSFDSPAQTTARGFLASRSMLLMAPDADVRAGDRVAVGGDVFAVDGIPEVARSPQAPKALLVKLREVTDAPA